MIKVKLAQILHKSSSNPLFEGVTIVNVKISPDGATAAIFYTVFSTERDVEKITTALNKSSGFFQQKLSNTMKTRNLPKLRFIFDRGFDHAMKVDSILHNLHDEDPELFQGEGGEESYED